MQEKSNIAYDFSLFQPSEKEKDPYKKPKKKNNITKITEEQIFKSKRKRYKLSVVLGAVLFSVITICIIGTVITSQVQLTELTEQINTTNKQLSEKQSLYTQLQMKVESKLCLRSVEDYAVNNLGMRPIQNYQTKYVNAIQGDKAEIKQSAPKDFIQTIKDSIYGILS